MSKIWFVKREEYPACASGNFRTIYQCQYDRSPIADYSVDFYLPQGMVEFEYLEGYAYVLSECDACSLIFQRDIPNEFLMERLYEYWINLRKASTWRIADLNTIHVMPRKLCILLRISGKILPSLNFLGFGMGWANGH